MDEALLPFPPPQPVLRVRSGRLETVDGWPIYRFVPYGAALQSGIKPPVVPWADQWPPYIQSWVSQYLPLPPASSETPLLQRRLRLQGRPGAHNPVQQALYQGWPLYVFSQDAPGDTPQGLVAGQFELVTIDVPPLTDPGVGWPDYYGGP
ncbi:hypothetical protein ACFFLM_08035 [Deinococcus oregonensis]|uniref:Uncharacterized protein n=1 Tax=Deinococcus oregonensis TaxID=1805970 RepID=A0ABV6AWM5_9DEIO